ncbi:MAG: hypothetical protein IT368_14745 [Candidatus Hydrogenedentes bacterium]|nr:hypothetical protein [Candidatus Hydrogenedentota bacterium]
MFERLVRHIVRATPDQLALFRLQDVALCRLWGDAQAVAGRSAEATQIDEAIRRWLDLDPATLGQTEGRRHQRLLRDAVAALAQPGETALSPDMARLLIAAADLAASSGRGGRIPSLVAPHLPRLRPLAAIAGPGVVLQELRGQVVYLLPEDLAAAPVQRISAHEGVVVELRGPVFRAPNHVRLLGDVPHECILIVDHGGCAIEGYVLGAVFVTGDCDVRENIGGRVIVNQGNVRCRGIIDRSWVSAKQGNIYCRHAHAPERVSVGGAIRVRDEILRGSYFAHSVRAGVAIRGGHVEVTRVVEAPVLGSHREAWLEIVLRRELTAEDYGQLIPGEVRQALAEAYRRRQAARDYDALAAMAMREAERLAESALMFLFGGGAGQKRLDEIVARQRRVNLLERMGRNVQQLLESAEARLLRGEAASTGTEEDLPEEEEADADAPEEGEWDAVTDLKRALREAPDRNRLWSVLQELRSERERIARERMQILKELETKERELLASGPCEDLRTAVGKGVAKVEVLRRVLPVVQRQPQSVLAERLRTPFMTRTLDQLERRLALSRRYAGLAEAAGSVFADLAEDLRRQHHVQVAAQDEIPEEGARVQGRFDGGVRVYLDMYTSDGARRPDKSLLEFSAPESAPRIITLDGAIGEGDADIGQ